MNIIHVALKNTLYINFLEKESSKMLQSLIFQTLTVNLLLLALAIISDMLFGEPPPKFHPTVWMGRFITFLERKLKANGTSKSERVRGILLFLASTTLFGLFCYLALYICYQAHFLLFLVMGVFLLKSTFAIKSMKEHAISVAEALGRGDLAQARKFVARIVNRDTSNLDEEHVISAAVESVAESTVDGFSSPLFYFSIFGVVGAFVYRVINTLDSMVGYRDKRYLYFGWFSALMDTITNFVPARITSYLMVLSSVFTGGNWKYTYEIFRRYRSKTESLNSGWPIAAMAGVLKVRLEKPGAYSIGEELRKLSTESIHQALRVMQVTILLFVTLVVIPLLIFMHLLV